MTKITCPTCGTEYLPLELFTPEEFFGDTIGIIKDENGKIKDVAGTSKENNFLSTECPKCKVPFSIGISIKFSYTVDTKLNFDEEYTTKLKKHALF